MLCKPVWQAFEGEEKGDSWAERSVRACEEGGMGAGVPLLLCAWFHAQILFPFLFECLPCWLFTCIEHNFAAGKNHVV